MQQPSFIYTPQDVSDKRKASYAAISRALARSPQNVGEGLNAIGQALIARTMLDEANQAAAQGRASGASAAAGIGALLPGGGSVPVGAAPAAGDASNIPPGLVSSESGGNFGARNAAMGAGGMAGHFGRLQFGQARLQEAAAAGAIPAGTTPQQFMASPQLQQAAERWHFNDIDSQIRANGLDRFVGQSIGGVPVTIDGMRAVAHLGGSAGLRQFLQSGGRYNPADANGTRLSDYLRRHASNRVLAATSTGSPDVSALTDAVSDELGLTQPVEPTSMQGGLGTPAMSPAEAFDAAGQSPLIDGRNLPAGDTRSAMQAPAMSPADAFGAFAPAAPPQQMAGLPEAGPQPAGGLTPAAPMEAPVPMARPANLGAPMAAPVPQPNLMALPPGAQPAGPAPAPQGGLSERDRLMLLRDEGSLGAGEAGSLRASLPGQPGAQSGAAPVNPVQMVARALGVQQAPAGAPAPAQPPSPAVAQVAAAMQGQPSAASPAAQPSPAGNDAQRRVAAALQIVNNPWAPEGTRAVAQTIIQQALTPANTQFISRPDGSIYAADPRTGTLRQVAAGTNAPVQWQPQKDEAGNITGFYNPQTLEMRDARGQPISNAPAQPQTPAATPVAPAGAQPPTPSQPTPAVGPSGLPLNRTTFQRQQDERMELARRNNIREGTPEHQFLMINGRIPTAGEKLTEQQSKDLVYHTRGAQALALLDSGVDSRRPVGDDNPRLSNSLASGTGAALTRVPLVGNYLQGDAYQRADQAGRNFLAAILRKDTGAAITAQEMDEYGRIFLPRPGDGKAVLDQKAEARRQAIDALRAGLGPAEAKALGQEAIRAGVERSSGRQAAQSSAGGVRAVQTPAEAEALPPGTRYRTPDGKEYVR